MISKGKKKVKPNKKVRNATPITVDGIHFKSKLEATVYDALKNNKTPAEYEPRTFELLPGFTFQGSKKRPITYTPDFIGKDFIIEAKGMPNDAFPLKWKLFMYHLIDTGLCNKYKLFIVHNKKELTETLEQLKPLRK